jgi:hypothetical protein
MDGAYPSAENIAASVERSIILVAPVVVRTGRNAREGTFDRRGLHHRLDRGCGDLPRRGDQPVDETRQTRPRHLRVLPP